jgi:hypothetical protein
LVTPVPLSPRLLLCCVSGGGSIKNPILGSAVQILSTTVHQNICKNIQRKYTRIIYLIF